MRNTRMLRASSTRDICIWCATCQRSATDAPLKPLALSQRRHLSSSQTQLQYASEGLRYKDDDAPTRPISRTERTGGQYLAEAPARTQRQVHGQQSQSSRQWSRGGTFSSPKRYQTEDRFAPVRRTGSEAPRHPDEHPRSWYRPYEIKIGSRPPIGNTPAFGVGNLRRRNEPRTDRAPPPNNLNDRSLPRSSRASRLDSSEIDRLLGSNSSMDQGTTPRPYARLSRERNLTRNCLHCGSQDHSSLQCPKKPVLRPSQRFSDRSTTQRGRPREQTLSEAAEAWARKDAAFLKINQQANQDKEDRWRKGEGPDRRRSRFDIPDDAPIQVRNRYEEPERRQRGGLERRSRNRVMREEDEEDEAYVDRAELKRQRKEAKKKMQEAKSDPTPVYLPDYINVAVLARLLKFSVEDFIQKLRELGFEDVQGDYILNAEDAGLIAQNFNFEPHYTTEEDEGDLRPAPTLSPEEYAQLPPRPPVVTIMGHVDHGKTTILDYMRSTSVAATEFGGITQHIGAFSVPLASGKKITFLDTPGHAAFETMRARGANVTDIVVLVVAADDSVMPQTVEAIKHAQAANVPIIVAINKIDKQQADPDAVKLDLGRHGIEVEDFGGEVQAVCVSGKTGQGIPDLEEAITTLSETLDHRADPKANVEGWILEGTTKKSGKVATVLVRSGTLRTGDYLVAGTTWTRVRSLRNQSGLMVKEVGPGMPVEVDGWREQPIAGDEVLQATDEDQAQYVSDLRKERVEREQLAKDMAAINETRRLEAERREAEGGVITDGDTDAQEPKKEAGPETVPFIVKGDVSGSVEAVIDSIAALGNAEVVTRILRHGVGSPSEFDVQHAADASGHIVNFNTAVPHHISALAEGKGVKILSSNIIYRVVEDVKALLSEKLAPRITQKVTGEVEVAMVFEIGLGGKKKMKVAGSKVRNGVVVKGTKARVLRRDEMVFDGVISSLKNQKKDADVMRKDTECGIAFEGWEDFRVGDKIQCYEEKAEKRSL